MTWEVWCQVVGYEGVYSVSSLGRIRRDVAGHGAVAGRILRPWVRPDGYLSVALSKDCVEKTYLVHSVVATAFLGSRPPGLVVNHIDADKTNNAVANLEWVSSLENTRHAFRLNRMHPPSGENHPRAKLSDADVAAIRRSDERISVLARRFGASMWTVQRIRLGLRRTVMPS